MGGGVDDGHAATLDIDSTLRQSQRRRRREAASECWRQRDGYMIVTNMLEVEATRMGREGVHEANNGATLPPAG